MITILLKDLNKIYLVINVYLMSWNIKFDVDPCDIPLLVTI